MEQQTYVGVAVKHKDKCLLCKRNKTGSYPGMWSIPAGKLEKGEETKQGAIREFHEETNIDISNENLVYCGLVPRTTRDGQKIKGIMYVYLLDSDKELIPDLNGAKDGEEHSECKYFSENELDEMSIGTKLFSLLKIIFQKN